MFNPSKYTTTKKFGPFTCSIRPARSSDRALVWKGYQTAPDEFFWYLTEITEAMVNQWYPTNRELDFSQTLPINVFLLDEDGEETEFVANMTLIFSSNNRFRHSTTMGMGVLPKFQGQGIGNYLTELSINISREKPGIVRLELHVVSKNERAKTMYKKFGYKEEGTLRSKWKYPDGSLDDIQVMSIIFQNKYSNG